MQSDERELRRLLRQLEPYAADFLLIGGWVPTLYARYGTAGAWATRPSRTLELDVALPSAGIPAAQRPLLVDVLRAAGLAPAHEPAPPQTGAAVWTGDTTSGAMIEFLMPQRGPHPGVTGPQSVTGQPGLTAVPLVGLELLWRDPQWLQLSGTPEVAVQIPALGMYVLNKAMTFPLRVPRAGERINPKQGKDLVYLHDCSLAGPTIVRSIVHDVEVRCAQDAALPLGSPLVRDAVDKAISNLELVQRGNFSDGMAEAIVQLSERERMTATTANATLLGALGDLCDILEPLRSPVEWPDELA